MSNERIFVLSGRQASGKSTYAKILREFLGKDHCQIFKFAQVIYELHDACLPILKKYKIITSDVEKEGALLQVLGNEYGRQCKGENVWVNITRREVDDYLAQHSKNYAVIDDCRFENEFDVFHRVANMIRLRANKEIRRARCSAWRENDTHASEIGLDAYEAAGNFDAIIDTTRGDPKIHLEELLKTWQYLEV